jgi:hypothetical protein
MNSSGQSEQSTVSAAFYGVLAIVLAIGALYIVYLGARAAPSVIGALVTASGAVAAVVAGRAYETRKTVEQARRERIAPVYERLMEMLYSIARGQTTGPELQAFYDELSKTLLVWGPPPVIKAFNTWRVEINEHGDKPREMANSLERLLYALRDDIGVSSSELERGDLARVWINDYDSYPDT